MRKCNCCGKLFDRGEGKFKSPIDKYDLVCFNCLNIILVSMENDKTSNDNNSLKK